MATYKPLQSVALTSNTTSVTFSGIDQSYTDLVIVGNVATSVAGAQNVMRFNGSTGNYSTTEIYGTGSVVSSYRFTGQSYLWFSSGVGIGNTLGQSSFTVHLNNYANSTANKTAMMRLNSNSGTYPGTVLAVAMWSNTSPITSVTLFADTGSSTFLAGSTFDLYGIKSGAPQALGGDVVTTDGNYWYHAFRSTGAFIPQRNLTCDYLVVAGGGAGGFRIGGGGGAGGFRASTGNSLIATTYPVIVGAGGTAATSFTGQGSNSSINSYISTGGGYGATGDVGNSAGSGGSGGGGSHQVGGQTPGSGNTPSTSPSQGNNGGNGSYAGGPSAFPGGGGGAGSVGGNGNGSSQSGSGGSGTSTYNGINVSTWLSATGTGVGGLLAAGGGAGCNNSNGSPGSGGGAGAGNGGGNSSATSATANTGSGGGGQRNDSTPSGAGGSGLVIVRYPV